MAIKDRIKEARLNKKYTQEQLANLIGVAKSTVTGYEKGNSSPSIDIFCKIMSVLDVDANYMYQDDTDFPLQVSYEEMKHIDKYRDLDNHGKEMVDFTLAKEYERSIALAKEKESNSNVTEFPEHLIANAANAQNPTEEQKQHADSIMTDDSEWT